MPRRGAGRFQVIRLPTAAKCVDTPLTGGPSCAGRYDWYRSKRRPRLKVVRLVGRQVSVAYRPVVISPSLESTGELNRYTSEGMPFLSTFRTSPGRLPTPPSPRFNSARSARSSPPNLKLCDPPQPSLAMLIEPMA